MGYTYIMGHTYKMRYALQLTAIYYSTLQHTATHCNTLQHTATQCNILQHTATHCNTLQHTGNRRDVQGSFHCMRHTFTLQHTATHCNTLQHTATHCNKKGTYGTAYEAFPTEEGLSKLRNRGRDSGGRVVVKKLIDQSQAEIEAYFNRSICVCIHTPTHTHIYIFGCLLQ